MTYRLNNMSEDQTDGSTYYINVTVRTWVIIYMYNKSYLNFKQYG